jgi:antitoxin PrlF
MQTLSSKVSEKFQITLPRQVRDAIRIKAGDRIVYVKDGSIVTIRRLDDLMDEVLDSFNDLEETELEFRRGFRMDEGKNKNASSKSKKIGKKTAVNRS